MRRQASAEGFDSLSELALDLRWSWNHRVDGVWRELDPDLWNLTHNPRVVLQTTSRDKLNSVLSDPAFKEKVDALIKRKNDHNSAPSWFQKKHSSSPLGLVAYFSMEFMLDESLPIYSGGLGNVAGDQLKAASDIGVPVVAIGLLYQQGYFRQTIDKDGWQHALYPYNDPGQLPVVPLRKENGEWLRIEIPLPGYSVWLRTWEVTVGRSKLYLLDTNDAANFPAHRGITSELYGGGHELRLQQEMLLGIGGWRLLETLGLKPQVCHLNEGHAALAVLERCASFMHDSGCTFHEALAVTRAGNLFTTHTAVAAGFDLFSPDLVEHYLSDYARNRLGISIQELLALGRLNSHDHSEKFNMSNLAIRGSGAVNAVSSLHGKVSRKIFMPLFPRWPQDEVPVSHVTNGVHMPSWEADSTHEMWVKSCGNERWSNPDAHIEECIRKIPDEELWKVRTTSRNKLIAYAREVLPRQLAIRGAGSEAIEQAKNIFDADTLTLGFARRFATYKRPNLLLHDPARLLRILTNPQRPVQLVIAGKAHPADKPGQALIKQWSDFLKDPQARRHVIFISDYDMHVTEQLVGGVDVWVNTPRRPWEASGTSGMKVLANGCLNLSELDGWWAEAYSPEVGWSIGDGLEHGDDPSVDAKEAEELYDKLEHQIIPEFYTRDENGIPRAWVKKMRESMASLTPHFSAGRTVSEYAEKHYIPAAKAYLARAENGGALGKDIVARREELDRKWDRLHFGETLIDTKNNEHSIEVQVYLDDVGPKLVKVELVADGGHEFGIIVCEMKPVRPLTGSAGGYVYKCVVPASRPASDFTARIVPNYCGIKAPLEDSRVLWQR